MCSIVGVKVGVGVLFVFCSCEVGLILDFRVERFGFWEGVVEVIERG